MPIIHVNGINLYYQIHGDGEPLIFGNGIFSNTLGWFNQTPVFSKEYQVILYDCRGQGRSDKPEGPYSLELHADDQKMLLEELGITSVHHIGISYGAEFGLVFAQKYPNMVKSLVVCSAVSFVGPFLRMVAQSWKAAAVREDPEMFFYTTVPFNFSETFMREQSDFIEQSKPRYEQLDFPAVVKLLDSFLQLDITARLPEIRTPTLVLVGENDILKPPSYSKLIHKRLPRSEMVIVRDSGHVVTYEKPEEFNSLVFDFLRKYAF